MANYVVEFTPRAKRELEKLPKLIQQRLRPRIDALAGDPRPPGVKALAGVADRWRIRVGDYRVVYTIKDEVLLVLVLRIGHRRDVYDRL